MIRALPYGLYLRAALKRFPSTQRPLLDILYTLSVAPCNLSYNVLYHVLDGMGRMNPGTYHTTLTKAVAEGLVTRTVKHRYVFYSITQDGIKMLYAVDMELERLVKKYMTESYRLRDLANKYP